MNSLWRSGPLGDFIELKRGYDLPSSQRQPGDVPLVSSSGISDFVEKPMVHGPGVVTGRYGTIGQVFFLEGDFWPLNTTLYVRDFKGNDPRFVSYFLRTIDFLSTSDKAAVPGVNRNHLHELAVSIPEPAAQQKISNVLGLLDDRIELLRETNATLEAIAQALFKSWFVDFDPVRAKSEGRKPEGIDDATAALFPDSFEDSPLGPIPTGWSVGPLSELSTIHSGTINPAKFPNRLFDHFSLPAFDKDQLPAEQIGSSIKSNKTTVPSNAVLLSKLNPHIPRVWLPSKVTADAVCSTEFLPFVPTAITSTEFVYSLVKSEFVQRSLQQFVTGTSNSHQRIRPEGVLKQLSVVPTQSLVACFSDLVSPGIERMKTNKLQEQRISIVRDSLLPRLISGRLRVPDQESAEV